MHRDIKPENIMLQGGGGELRLRVLDFGLAKVVQQVTRTYTLSGTPIYMAPEQIKMRHIGPWTDLYAAGVLCYEMVCGRELFPGHSVEELLVFKSQAQPTLLDEVVPSVRPFFERALAWDYRERFQSAAAFRDGLQQMLSALRELPTGASPTSVPEPSPAPAPADAAATGSPAKVVSNGADPEPDDTHRTYVVAAAPPQGERPPRRSLGKDLALVAMAALAVFGLFSFANHLSDASGAASSWRGAPVGVPSTVKAVERPSRGKPVAKVEPRRETTRVVVAPKRPGERLPRDETHRLMIKAVLPEGCVGLCSEIKRCGIAMGFKANAAVIVDCMRDCSRAVAHQELHTLASYRYARRIFCSQAMTRKRLRRGLMRDLTATPGRRINRENLSRRCKLVCDGMARCLRPRPDAEARANHCRRLCPTSPFIADGFTMAVRQICRAVGKPAP